MLYFSHLPVHSCYCPMSAMAARTAPICWMSSVMALILFVSCGSCSTNTGASAGLESPEAEDSPLGCSLVSSDLTGSCES